MIGNARSDQAILVGVILDSTAPKETDGTLIADGHKQVCETFKKVLMDCIVKHPLYVF